MKARVFVTLKTGVLDPQGKAIGHALNGLGFAAVGEVRQGKVIDLELAETDAAIEDAAIAFPAWRAMAPGDRADVLRRFAAGAAERDRVAEDAKSATAQARFTGLLVVAMPTGGALFAELVQPGFLARLFGSPISAVLLVMAAALQLVGFVAIKRFSRVVE